MLLPPLGYSMGMAGTREKLTAAVESYLGDLRRVRTSRGATGERSYYPALTNLLNAVGARRPAPRTDRTDSPGELVTQ